MSSEDRSGDREGLHDRAKIKSFFCLRKQVSPLDRARACTNALPRRCSGRFSLKGFDWIGCRTSRPSGGASNVWRGALSFSRKIPGMRKRGSSSGALIQRDGSGLRGSHKGEMWASLERGKCSAQTWSSTRGAAATWTRSSTRVGPSGSQASPKWPRGRPRGRSSGGEGGRCLAHPARLRAQKGLLRAERRQVERRSRAWRSALG